MERKVEQRCYRRAGLGPSIPCGHFTKDGESINTGLVLYDFFLHAEKSKSSQNVLQNRKHVKLSSRNTQRSFENCIETCPRCINICKRTKGLLNNISTLGKRKTLGVCSNCGTKIQNNPSRCKCNVIFNKLLNSAAKDLDIDEHNIKTCDLSIPHRFTTGFLKNESSYDILKLQTYSDSCLNKALKKYYGQKSSQKPTDRRQVKIKPLFQSEIDLSKLYITQICHLLLQEQKALGFRKTRLRIRKQPHDQAFQFHFIFPSEKKDLDSTLQVNSSQLLHEIQAKRKTNIHEKKSLSAKANKQTLPWQRGFSISSLQGKSIESLHEIHAKYGNIKTPVDKILEERHSRDLEKKNLGAKINKQTLPWQSDFSLLSLEGKTLELLHDIRAKYMETKILEDKILDFGKKNLGAKSDKRILPWEGVFARLQGNSLEVLHDIHAKYGKIKTPEDKISAERRKSDFEMKNLGAKTNKQILPWQRDSTPLGLEGNSLELLHDIRGKYKKTKILENKILAERRSGDLEMENLGAKTNKQTLPWQRDSPLLGLEGNSLELLHEIRGKYRKTKKLENKIIAERRSSDLEMKNLGAKTNKQIVPWQRDSPLLGLKEESLDLLPNIRGKYRKTKKLENKILAERRNSNVEMKNLGAKTNKQTVPWQRDSPLLGLEGNSLELLHDIRGKYRKTKILENKILAERRSSELEIKNLGAKTNKQILPWQRDSTPLGLEGNSLELLHDMRGKYRKTKILQNKILAERRSSDLEMKNLGAKTNKQILPWQRVSTPLGLEGNSLELLHDIRGKYRKTKLLENKILAERRSSDLEMKNLRAKKTKQTLPLQRDSSLLSLKENSLELLNNIQAKYENKKRQLELIRDIARQKDYSLLSVEAKYEEKKRKLEKQRIRDLENNKFDAKIKKHRLPWQKESSLLKLNYEEKERQLEEQRNSDLERYILGAKTKKHGLPRQKDSSLVNLETKYEEKEKHLGEQRNWDLEKKVPGVKTKKHELPRQKDYSLLNLEVKYEEKQKHLKKQRSKDLEKKKPDAKTKDNGLLWQKDSSLLYLEPKYEKTERDLEKQHSKDLEKKKLGAKTKKHGLPLQKDSLLLSIEGKSEKKKRRLEDQLSRDLERTESKNLGAITKKYKLPWPKKDSRDLNLEEETATITQANVITDEQTERYHKKQHDLNKKEDRYNELHDSNSEINGMLVKKTSKEIEERRKKNQAVLEMLTRMQDRNKNSGTSLTMLQRRFLDTDLSEKAERKMNIYGMVLSHPEFDWFAKNKDRRNIFYDSGEILAKFSENGRGRWFYRDGKLALDYYNTEKSPPGRRLVVYSSGKPDRKGRARPQTVLASFDHSGNAVVFDHAGNIRLKYDQNEGVVLDPSIGPESHWKWHSRNDLAATTDGERPFVHPAIQKNEEDGLEKENKPTHKRRVHKLNLKKTVHERSKGMTQSYKPFEIQMKALKINENFALKILSQAKVYLIFTDDTTHIKIHIGMAFNKMKILDIETCYVGDVFNPLEKFPADTRSVVELQVTVAKARLAEQARVRHRGRLMRPVFVG